MNILEEIASKAIRSGGNALEIEHKDGYEEIFPVSGSIGTSVGFRLKSSSEQAKSLLADLSSIAKRKRRISVDGREYELRCRVYDNFDEHAFRLHWRLVEPASHGRVRRDGS
ncbi:hypothetical protein L6R21_16860 [bacterium]|nr:hypothetical protein [bacterium]